MSLQSDMCPLRLGLSNAVVQAVNLKYRAKVDYDTARKGKAGNLDAWAALLAQARAEEHTATRNLREHIEQHRCK